MYSVSFDFNTAQPDSFRVLRNSTKRMGPGTVLSVSSKPSKSECCLGRNCPFPISHHEKCKDNL